MNIDTPLANIIHPTLVAIAESVGVPLPNCILSARTEVLNSCTIEVLSFIVFYADRHESGALEDGTETVSKVINDWREISGSDLYNSTLYRARTEVFFQSILGKKKFSPRKTFGIKRGNYKIKTMSPFSEQQSARKAAIICK